MKLFLIIGCALFSGFAIGQRTKTVMSDLGKVGNLRFTLAKSDTSNAVSITQGQSLLGGGDLKIVTIYQNEVAEVIKTLNSFIEETGKKAANNTVITYKTNNLLLSCNYFKLTGWNVVIQNTDPALDQDLEKTWQRSGIRINNFVEVKPGQLSSVIKILSGVN